MEAYRFFINQFFLGIVIVIVFLFGTSLADPHHQLHRFHQRVQIGFSCAPFICTYQFKGLLGIFLTLVPQVLTCRALPDQCQ
ncbi:MAG: hypothetical protein ACLVJ6_15120 [Merdibacter sp.]